MGRRTPSTALVPELCGSRLVECVLPSETLPARPSFLPHVLPTHQTCTWFQRLPVIASLTPSGHVVLPERPELMQWLQNSIPPKVIVSSPLLLAWAVLSLNTGEMEIPLLKIKVRSPPASSSFGSSGSSP